MVERYIRRYFQEQELLAYEMGYRWKTNQNVYVDITGFFNRYDNLRSTEYQNPAFETEPSPPHLLIPGIFDNKLYGETYRAIYTQLRWQF